MGTYQRQMARMYMAMFVSGVLFSASLFAAEFQIKSSDPASVQVTTPSIKSDMNRVDSMKVITPQPVSSDVLVQPTQSDVMQPQPSSAEPTKAGVTNQAPVVVDLSQTYTNKDKGYSIVFPKNWEMKEKFMGLDVFALSPLEGDKDLFRENVNIITEDLTKPMSLDDYYSMGLVNLKTLLTDFKEVESGNIDVNGIPMKWIVYDHRMGEVKARVLQFIAVKDRRAYVVTFSAMPDDFAKYRPAFEQIAKTYKFNEAAKEAAAPAKTEVKTTTEVTPAVK
jgi:hypothetical protein